MSSDDFDDEPFVTLTTIHDPVQARMVGEQLEQEGIPTILPGLEHRGMLGSGGAFMAVPVQVPQSRTAEARELIDALFHSEAEFEPGHQVVEPHEPSAEGQGAAPGGPYRVGGAAARPSQRPKRKFIAIFLSIAFVLGLGHMYARSYRAGLLLMSSSVLALMLQCAGAQWVGLTLPLVVVVDLFGSLYAVERYNTGREPGPRDRVPVLAPSLVPLILIALAVPWGMRQLGSGPEAGPQPPEETAAVCDRVVRCNNVDASTCVERVRERVQNGNLPPKRVVSCAQCIEKTYRCGHRRRCARACRFLSGTFAR